MECFYHRWFVAGDACWPLLGLPPGLVFHVSPTLGKALYHLTELNRLTEEIQHARRQIIEESYQQELDRIERDVQRAVNHLMQELHQQLPVRQTEVDDFMKKLGFVASDWHSQSWQEQWQRHRAGSASPPVTRIGKLTVNATPALPPIPALISCPNGSNLLWWHLKRQKVLQSRRHCHVFYASC